ncbi:putative dinucleotide-binding enzyme [Rhizobium azibense]|uniref:Putative dinucleotide-binding enzyme n=1 Tax=Rhizobium azibense TaxID=1136135 RepID=A0A4R3RRJ6_9HYPH|nr:putative dinucleotide-binding enzyme [Rhizobium azibense]
MKVGIIGSGEIGGSLARRLSKLGHQVSIANSRGPDSLADLAAETGAKAVTIHEAARSGEVVFVAIPAFRIADLPKDLFDGVDADVAVVETGNYYPQERDGRIDPIEEGAAESRWVRSRLMREPRGSVFGMADRDLLEVLDAPEIAVLANGAEIEARHAERLRAHLGIPAVEAAEVEVRRAVGKTPGLDRIEVVDQEEEDVAIGGVERRGVLGDIDARIVDPGRPVEHPRHFPTGVTRAVAGDALNRGDQFVVEDAGP